MPEYKFTPILVISSEKDVIEKSISIGTSAWLEKSSKTNDKLLATINKLI